MLGRDDFLGRCGVDNKTNRVSLNTILIDFHE
jgi:hypothetical protein